MATNDEPEQPNADPSTSNSEGEPSQDSTQETTTSQDTRISTSLSWMKDKATYLRDGWSTRTPSQKRGIKQLGLAAIVASGLAYSAMNYHSNNMTSAPVKNTTQQVETSPTPPLPGILNGALPQELLFDVLAENYTPAFNLFPTKTGSITQQSTDKIPALLNIPSSEYSRITHNDTTYCAVPDDTEITRELVTQLQKEGCEGLSYNDTTHKKGYWGGIDSHLTEDLETFIPKGIKATQSYGPNRELIAKYQPHVTKHDTLSVMVDENGVAHWTRCTPDGLEDVLPELPEGVTITYLIPFEESFVPTYTKVTNTPATAEKNCSLEAICAKGEHVQKAKQTTPYHHAPVVKEHHEPVVQKKYHHTHTPKHSHSYKHHAPTPPTPLPTTQAAPLPQCTADQLNNWVVYNGQAAKQASKQSDARVLKMRQGDKTIYHVNHGGGNFDMVVLDNKTAYFDEDADGSLDTQYTIRDKWFGTASENKIEKWLFDEINGKNRKVDVVKITERSRKEYAGIRATMQNDAIKKWGADCSADISTANYVPTNNPVVEFVPKPGDIIARKERAYGGVLRLLSWDHNEGNRSFEENYPTIGGFVKGFVGKKTAEDKYTIYEYDAEVGIGRDGNSGSGRSRGGYNSYGYGGKTLFYTKGYGLAEWLTDVGDKGGLLLGGGAHGKVSLTNRSTSLGRTGFGYGGYGYGPSYGYTFGNSQSNTNISLQVGPHATAVVGDPLGSNFSARLGLNLTSDIDRSRFGGYYGTTNAYGGASVFGEVAYKHVFKESDGYWKIKAGAETGKDFWGSQQYRTKNFTAFTIGGEVMFDVGEPGGNQLYIDASLPIADTRFGGGGQQNGFFPKIRVGWGNVDVTRACTPYQNAQDVNFGKLYKNYQKNKCD